MNLLEKYTNKSVSHCCVGREQDERGNPDPGLGDGGRGDSRPHGQLPHKLYSKVGVSIIPVES